MKSATNDISISEKKGRLKVSLKIVNVLRMATAVLGVMCSMVLFYLIVVGQLTKPSAAASLVPTLSECSVCNGYGYVYFRRVPSGIAYIGAPNTVDSAILRTDRYAFIERCGACITGTVSQLVPYITIILELCLISIFVRLGGKKSGLQIRLGHIRQQIRFESGRKG